MKSKRDFGFVEKKVSFSLFYAIFLKEYFKVLFKQLVFDTFEFFFRRLFEISLMGLTMMLDWK